MGEGVCVEAIFIGEMGEVSPSVAKNLLIPPPPGKVPPVEPPPLAKNLIIPPAPGKVPPVDSHL